MYEQLYPEMLSRSNAGPAVINDRIDGITSMSKMCDLIPLFKTAAYSGNLPV
jgi:hypothetical protein